MRTATLLAILLLGVGVSACGQSATDQVRGKVEQFAGDAGAHDYLAICDRVLSTALLERLAGAGVSCPGALQQALGGVRSPVLSIGRIEVRGPRASVITLSAAAGQNASLAEIDLVREAGGWRIDSLGGTALKGS